MMELSGEQISEVAGGISIGSVYSIAGGIQRGFSAYVAGISAAGATLSNYYGMDMTVAIFVGGNMGA